MQYFSETFSVKRKKFGVCNLNIFSMSESFSVRASHRSKRGESFSVTSSHWEQFWPFFSNLDIGFSLTTPICQWEAEFSLTKRMFILYLIVVDCVAKFSPELRALSKISKFSHQQSSQTMPTYPVSTIIQSPSDRCRHTGRPLWKRS